MTDKKEAVANVQEAMHEKNVQQDVRENAQEEPAKPAGEEQAAAGEAESVAELPSYEELAKALQEADAKATDMAEKVIRTQAEMQNLRRRTERDMENAHKYALEKIAGELLPVKDSLEMGLGAATEDGVDIGKVVEGIELTLKMLSGVMDKFGIAEVNPLNEKFDPEVHQAMTVQASAEVEPNHVLNVYQKGYLLNDRLLRPALVVVSKAADDSPDDGKIDESA